MTILSLQAHIAHIHKLCSSSQQRTTGEHEDGWHTGNETVASENKFEHEFTMKVVSNGDGYLKTYEVGTLTMYDDVGGQNFAGGGLVQNEGMHHAVNNTVFNIQAVFEAIVDGLKSIGVEQVSLMCVSDKDATASMSRTAAGHFQYLGTQMAIVTTSGKVYTLPIDRFTINSVSSTKYGWRMMLVDEGCELAYRDAMRGFKQAAGYIDLPMGRLGYFEHEMSAFNGVVNPHLEYVHRIAKPKTVFGATPLRMRTKAG